MTHEVEGSHASISAQLARRYGESQHVVHAIEAHHYEIEPQTVEAVLLIAADAISASRPGARGESLEHYIKRLASLEDLAAIMAAELGASQKTARRAALLHDLGKAVTHEVEGSHAVISAEMARKYRESPSVVHAIEAHHYDVEPQTVEAVLVIAADSVSASRPGGRGESLEHYIKRLEALEEIATSKKGVDRCYAMQAGREVRVMVKPEEIDDDTAALLSHEIAREIEGQLEYPGQIKVTVIRESRSVDVAH